MPPALAPHPNLPPRRGEGAGCITRESCPNVLWPDLVSILPSAFWRYVRQMLRRGYIMGGCSPTVRNTRRKLRSSGRFRDSATTVALPMAVRPMMTMKSSLQAKCRDQRCRRGLKSGTTRPVCGSGASIFVYLCALHQGHAQARLSKVVSPPASRGRICTQ